jgi:cobalt-zinc-cadmium efflux system outer membrane protein
MRGRRAWPLGLCGLAVLTGCRLTDPRPGVSPLPATPTMPEVTRASWVAQDSHPATEAARIPETPPNAVEAPGAGMPLASYIGRALAENRDVLAARSEIEAMRARVPQALSLDDPMVQTGTWPFPMNAPQYALMGYMPYEMMVTQQFPWLGTLRLRGLVAEQEVRAAVARLVDAQIEAVAEVKRAYYSLRAAERVGEILRENRTLAEQVVELARARLVGGGAQQDVLRAEVAIAEIDRDLVLVEQEAAEARAALAQVLHIDPETPLTAAEPPPSAMLAPVESLYALAERARPDLQARLAEVERDKHEVELARKKYLPDMTLGVNYMTMTRKNNPSPEADGRDNVGFVVGFNVPIYRRKLDAGVCEAEARVRADSRRFEADRDRAFRQIKERHAQALAQRETLALLSDRIAPKSRQALQSAASGYRAGTLDFVTLNTARQELLDVEVQIARAEASLGRALADLERAVGAPLVGLPHPVGAPAAPIPESPPPPAEGATPFRDPAPE